MKICITGKYPPLEGGISAKIFWLAQALAERGHTIHIVTDQIGVDETYTIPETVSIPTHPNITIHRPDKKIPWHIPNDSHRDIALLDKLLEVIEEVKPDIIEAGYLVPYGQVAYIASQITGIPFIINHGGSDINKFVKAGLWPILWKKVFSSAKYVITDMVHRNEIEQWRANYHVLSPYVPNPDIFSSLNREKNKSPVLALIGKANHYWQHKGWDRVIDIWANLEGDFDFVIVSQGIGLEKFQDYANKKLGNRIVWKKFLPPWEMPGLLKSIDALFYFEENLPFPMFSNLVIEALFCGTAIISDRSDILKKYNTHGLNMSHQERLVLHVSMHDLKSASEKIKNLFNSSSEPILPSCFSEYNEYLSTYEQLFTTMQMKPS